MGAAWRITLWRPVLCVPNGGARKAGMLESSGERCVGTGGELLGTIWHKRGPLGVKVNKDIEEYLKMEKRCSRHAFFRSTSCGDEGRQRLDLFSAAMQSFLLDHLVILVTMLSN
ncbi:hypothetical protein EJB05_03198, partial [Eragrostis curvula]